MLKVKYVDAAHEKLYCARGVGDGFILLDAFIKVSRDPKTKCKYYHFKFVTIEDKLIEYSGCSGDDLRELDYFFDGIDCIHEKLEFYQNDPKYYEEDVVISLEELFAPLSRK